PARDGFGSGFRTTASGSRLNIMSEFSAFSNDCTGTVSILELALVWPSCARVSSGWEGWSGLNPNLGLAVVFGWNCRQRKKKRMNNNPTVLYVDDDDNDVLLLKHAIRSAKMVCHLQVVNDPEMASAYLGGEGAYADRKCFPLPALVLLDLKMPRMHGL